MVRVDNPRASICLLTLVLTLTLAPRVARACTAGPMCSADTATELYADSDAVFRGVVVEYRVPWLRVLDEEDRLPRAIPPDMYGLFELNRTAEFEIVEAWKGVETRTVTIHAFDSSCGLGMAELVPGMELLVFARRFEDEDPDRLWTHPCYVPMPVDHEWSRATIADLGPGRRELPARWAIWLLVLEGLAVGAAGLLLVGWARRRRAMDAAMSE